MAVDFWAFVGASVAIVGLIITVVRFFVIDPLKERIIALESDIKEINKAREARTDQVNEKFSHIIDLVHNVENDSVKEMGKLYQKISSL